jgi:DNA (cytosine-5)-methyltransferase 1
MNEKLRHLDLFSGIGGFALGLESTGGFETVGFCDNEPFAQKVLKKHWPDVPCYEDVRDVGVDTVGYRGVDIITGGFPCQPFSVAGKQDPNDNRQLWPEMFRIIKEIRPTYVIGENVRNLISIREGLVFEQVCTDLEGEGYEVQTFVLPASAVNAPHQRYRCWILSHSKHDGFIATKKREGIEETVRKKQKGKDRTRNIERAGSLSKTREDVANSDNARWEKQWWQESAQEEQQTTQCGSWWSVEPSVGRVAHGIPNRVDRLKGLGNAVVPQIPAVLGRAILEVHNG